MNNNDNYLKQRLYFNILFNCRNFIHTFTNFKSHWHLVRMDLVRNRMVYVLSSKTLSSMSFIGDMENF